MSMHCAPPLLGLYHTLTMQPPQASTFQLCSTTFVLGAATNTGRDAMENRGLEQLALPLTKSVLFVMLLLNGPIKRHEPDGALP
jgi:hypothetical protein